MASGSISTGISTILSGISSTSTAITKFIRIVRAAHTDLAAVTRELSELRLVLELLINDESEVPGPLHAPVLEILDSCGNHLACIDSLLAEYTTSTQWSTGGKSQITPLKTGLETYRSSLALVLEVVSLAHAQDDPTGAKAIRDQMLAEIARIRGQVPHVTDEDGAMHSYLDNVTGYAEASRSEPASTPPTFLSGRKSSSAAIAIQSRSQPPSPSAPMQTQQSPRADSSPPRLQPVSEGNASPGHPHRSTDPRPLPFRPSTPARRQTEPMQPIPRPRRRSPARPARRETGPVPANLPIEQSSQPPPEVVNPPPPEMSRKALPPRQVPSSSSKFSLFPQTTSFESVGPWYPREDLTVPFYQNNNNPTLPVPTNSRNVLNIDNRARAYSNSSQASQNAAPTAPPRRQPHIPPPSWQSQPKPPYNETPEVNVQQYTNQNFIPAPVLFESRVPSAMSSHGPSSPPTREGSIANHGQHRFSDASIPATPKSSHSVRTASSNEQSHGFGSPSPDVQTFASPPTTYAKKSPNPSHPTTPNHFSRASAPEALNHKRASIDSFQLSSDPLGVHHTRSSFPGTSPLPRNLVHSPAPSSVYSTASIQLAQEINPAFPFLIAPMFPGGSFMNGQMSPGSNLRASKQRLDIFPARYFIDKEKGPNIYHVDVSPSSAVVATKHGNNAVKIWSLMLGSLQTTIKFTSYVNAQVRSREYFIRSHAILSESATMVGITASFGHSIEVWNWAKKKKLQVIDDAHRWASMRADVYRSSWAPLAVYRGPSSEKIDLLRVSPDAGTGTLFKAKIFVETRPIELRKAGLPFVPRFPELAYSSTSPLLVAAAGPRPGDASKGKVLLAAWQLAVLHGEAHQLYRHTVPDHPGIQTALPVCLTVHGTICVSIWIPANHRDVAAGSSSGHGAAPIPARYVIVWDLSANTTRIFAIPDVLACVSPDCRLVAYCDASAPALALIDVLTEEEVCRWPDLHPVAGYGQLDDLSGVTEFAFSNDGRMLVIGDEKGGVGSYELRDSRKYEQLYQVPPTPASQWSELGS